ncbi:hypothetical protein C8Q77DRAFT_336975 [Trametes polyzona]|nr:hypothetical protein C8Q77DRAFT_336975 [Trametes polyzona]
MRASFEGLRTCCSSVGAASMICVGILQTAPFGETGQWPLVLSAAGPIGVPTPTAGIEVVVVFTVRVRNDR